MMKCRQQQSINSVMANPSQKEIGTLNLKDIVVTGHNLLDGFVYDKPTTPNELVKLLEDVIVSFGGEIVNE